MTKPERVLKIHLAKLLEERGLTQAQLADAIDVRRATINDLYHNRSKQLPIKVIAAIMDELNLTSIDELITVESRYNDNNE